MINLLPPHHADRIRYGRTNSKLRRWVFGMLVAILGLVVILVFGWLYIDQQSKNLNEEVANYQQQLDQQNLEGVKKDAEEISSDIKVINQVLGREIRFSHLIQDIGKIMPSGTILSALTLTKANGTVDLSANAIDYSSAAQVSVNLNDPKNGLFDKVDIVNINCGATNDTGNQYKCTATYKALFSKTAQSKYISVPGSSLP